MAVGGHHRHRRQVAGGRSHRRPRPVVAVATVRRRSRGTARRRGSNHQTPARAQCHKCGVACGACKSGAVLRATCVGHPASTMGEVLRQVRALSSSGQFVPPPHVRVRASDMSIFVVWLDMDRTRPFV